MAGKLIVFLGLAVLAKGAVVPAIPAVAAPIVAPVRAAKLEELDAIPQYSFAYDVQDALTGDSKAQYETRNGDIVQGSYSLIEADGTRRIVEYTADPINGFNAVVSREPATAVAAIAAPVVPYTPAVTAVGVAPAVPAAAPAPAIPASGPDSDVEVVEARSGPLVAAAPMNREEQLRQQQEQQLQQLRNLERQQQEQQQEHLQQIQRLQQQQQQQQARFSKQQPQSQQQEQEIQEQPQQNNAPVRAFASPIQVAAIPRAQKIIGLPAARAVTGYAGYPTAYAYTAAYSSPFAYAAPVGGLTYAPAAALL